mmetsp:Transcript_10627/g.31075  ORF Transcript_10627/g.31075 Transcript_10627/m.31075 type:complete len:424 (+) Transcript_10627:112-1383(+)
MSNESAEPESSSVGLPRRCIFDDIDMKCFMESSTKTELLNFVEAMGKACASPTGDGASFDPAQPLPNLPPAMACLHGSLQEMVRWVDDIPPVTESSGTASGSASAISIRFGNPSFRTWHDRLVERSDAIITTILQARSDDTLTPELACQRGKDAAAGVLKPEGDDSVRQVSPYLHDSFGHSIRLDYGTGHESSFLVFLLILSKAKCFGKDEAAPSLVTLRAVTLSLFDQYLKVTRRLQTDYRLEPAGSHGVWGLDDYHCLPFYFGACQLGGTSGPSIPHELQYPRCIMDERTINDYGDQYMYLGCIRYIRQLKQGVPFFESSPMLFDISQTMPSWDKVARGLLRLYQGEVLDKKVVVQHFVFSKLFPCTWTPSRTELPTPPTETFRTNPQEQPPIPVTRAPWAKAAPGGNIANIATTRAPWAK